MTLLPITLTIAGACGLLSLWLAFRVSRIRLRDKISLGDAGNAALLAHIRAHANFSEYAPLFLILLGLVELAVGSRLPLWVAGASFVLARVAHAIGMGRPPPNAYRVGGAAVTWLLLGGLAAYAIVLPYLAG